MVPRAMVSLATLGGLALCACSGTSGDSAPGSSPSSNQIGGTFSSSLDPTARGPVTLPGAHKGGIVTVLTANGLTTTLDPSEIYFTDTSSVFSGLIGRSLTQYRYDPTTRAMVLVPDLATDLGTHNDDYTRWSFTIRPGVRWENGDPVTAGEVAWGMTRCMDKATFPTGACQFYSNVYYQGGSGYRGPYTSHQKSGTIFDAIKVDGDTITITMAKPFPDMPYWGTFPANGPVPTDPQVSEPKNYKRHPWSTGPYMIKSYSEARELVLARNPYWDPRTDPARTQYPDGYDFRSQQASARIDQILLADSGTGQSTLTIDDLLAPDYQQLKEKAPDRLTLGGAPCTYFWAPDNRKITDKRVREALSWAFPYKDVILADSLIPNVNAIPATSLMPPGVPGRTAYNVTGRQGFDSDPAKAESLLRQAGAVGFEIRFLYRSDFPTDVRTKDVLVKALTEAGFTATPVPTTSGNLDKVKDDPNTDVNVRAAGWCSDWPSGATWLPPLLGSTDPDKTQTFGANYSAFSNSNVDARMDAIQRLPLEQQAAAWNDLDQQVAKKYFPLFTTFYAGVAQAHGSRINGDFDDSILGMPTWKDVWISH
jgi:peptide/nickel transport system substrate-binding protein